MKRILVLLAFTALMTSCDNDFKVGADYKEVSVIYGLLDDGLPSNDHYIKVTKGFFSETLNNRLVAQTVDSIYFKDLDVVVEEFENGNRTNSFTCSRVDLASLPIPLNKEDGIFVDSPNYAYHFSADLEPKRQYKLTVKNNETGKTITGETSIINADPFFFKFTRPFATTDVLDFTNPDLEYTFRWNAPQEAELFDILLRFHYDELDLATNVTQKKSVDLTLGKFIEAGSGSNQSYAFSNSDFYSLLTANIGAGGTKYTRLVDTAELFFVAGDNQLKTYIDVNNAQGGLTNDQIKPIYSNLAGEDVIGLFASRATRRFGFINFSTGTYDAIINGDLARNLNFTGRSKN